MSTIVRGGVVRVTCDEPGCSACAFDEEADDRWWDGWAAEHRCPEHQSALAMAEKLEREQQRRAG